MKDRPPVARPGPQCEAKHRAFFEYSMDAMLLTRPDGAILAANPAACDMFRLSEEQIVRGGRAAVVDASDPRLPRLLEQRVREGRARGEITLVRGDGSRFSAEVSSAIFDGGDGELYTSMIVRDLADRERAQAALHESEERYRQLLDVSPVGIAVQQDGRLVFANPAGARILGASSPLDLIGKPIAEIVHPDGLAQSRQRIEELLAGRQGWYPVEDRYLRLDGTVVEVEVTAAPLIYEGRPAVQVVVMDISERRSLERKLLQAQKMESLGTLAGGIAHDFNNILAIIVGHAGLLRGGTQSPEGLARSLDAIVRASERGAVLVQQILAYAGQSRPLFEPVCVNAIVAEVASLMRETFPSTIAVATRLQADLPAISADPAQIHQILLNLCVNSRDAMPQGGSLVLSTGTISGDLLRRKHPEAGASAYAAIDVGDTGAGMNDETLRRIFEPFFTTKDIGKGTGLGMPMVYGIVTRHGGALDVESRLGVGTTVHIYLPLAAPAVGQ